jgi:hypothetical protein
MPDLATPIFNCEPISSLVGAMHFPDDFEKAAIVASWKLGGALQAASNEQIALIDRTDPGRIWAVHNMARGYPKIAKEAGKAATSDADRT